MGRFHHQLRDTLATVGARPSLIADNAKLPQSQLSRWMSGKYLPTPDALLQLMSAIPAQQQPALLAAWVHDTIPQDLRPLVVVSTESATIAELPQERTWPEGLSEETRRKLVRFASLLRDYPEIEAIIDELLSLSVKLK